MFFMFIIFRLPLPPPKEREKEEGLSLIFNV